MQGSADFNVKNKHDHVNAELDGHTLVFKSQLTSVARVSDMNALAGLLCCGLETPQFFVRCGNARFSGFCWESHPPIAFLIPDALPNDTENVQLSGRAEKSREKVTEKVCEDSNVVWGLIEKYDLMLTDTELIADLSLWCYNICDLKEMCMSMFWLFCVCVCLCVFPTAASIMVSRADTAGAQQVCSLIPVPLHLPVCPSMFAHAHCVLHRRTPGLCCTWARCPVICLTRHTHTHTCSEEHAGTQPVPVTG